MQRTFTSFLETSIVMSVVILAFMVITPLITKRYAAKGRYYTWLVIVMGLIVPFRLHPQFFSIQLKPSLPIIHATQSIPVYESTMSVAKMHTEISWYASLSYIWLTGAICFLVYHAVRHWQFLKFIKRWSVGTSDQEILDVLNHVQTELGVSSKINVRVFANIDSPLLVGFLHPTILLPSEKLPYTDLALVLRHELVHFKRKDLWYKTFIFLAVALHWFNPFVYLMAKEISLQCELSCDEEVIKGNYASRRQQYIKAIMCAKNEQLTVKTMFSTNFYDGGRKEMKNRVLAIMGRCDKKIGIGLLVAVSIATLGTGMVLAIDVPSLARITPTYTSMIEVESGKEFPDDQLSAPLFTIDKLSLDNNKAAKEHDIPINATIIYSKEGGSSWTLKKDQIVVLDLAIVDRGFEFGQGTEIGYILNGEKVPVFSEQIKSGVNIEFVAPKSGDYFFYIKAESSDPLLVESFSIS